MGIDLSIPWSHYSMADKPWVIVLLVGTPHPPRDTPPTPFQSPVQISALIVEEGLHLGRKMLLQGQNGASEEAPKRG